MTQNPTLDRTALREAIQHEYDEVATTPTKGFHFHVGRELARRLDYPNAQVDRLPDSVVESFAGVGNPFALGSLSPGEVVLDLGSGAGFDAFLAARQVGPTGRVIGVDMTPAMLDKARANAALLDLDHVEFREGVIESLPVADNSIDVIISNGVINLSPDKDTVFAEAFRGLKPGGRLQIADIIVDRDVPEEARDSIDLWTGWIAGALPEAALAQIIRNAGFEEIRFSDVRYDTFSDAPQASSAAAFGTQGVTFSAVKPTGARKEEAIGRSHSI